MQEEVFDQNDGNGSESAAGESGAKKKWSGVLYIISASAVEGRLLVHAHCKKRGGYSPLKPYPTSVFTVPPTINGGPGTP